MPAGKERTENREAVKVLLDLLTENSQNIKKMPQIPRYHIFGQTPNHFAIFKFPK